LGAELLRQELEEYNPARVLVLAGRDDASGELVRAFRRVSSLANVLDVSVVDILTIKELLGHKTLAMTLRYSHLSPGHQRQAVDRLVSVRSDTGISTGRKDTPSTL